MAAACVEPSPQGESSVGTHNAAVRRPSVHHAHSGGARAASSPAASCRARSLLPKAGDKGPTLAEIIIEQIKKIPMPSRFPMHRHLVALAEERDENQQWSHYRDTHPSSSVPTCHPVDMGACTEDISSAARDCFIFP